MVKYERNNELFGIKMENAMTGTGLELALILKGVKYLGICLFVWFIEPILGLVILQVDTVAFLTPHVKAVLNDWKIILSVAVPAVLFVKYIIDIVKAKKK